MRGLATLIAKEEEPVRSGSENCRRHGLVYTDCYPRTTQQIGEAARPVPGYHLMCIRTTDSDRTRRLKSLSHLLRRSNTVVRVCSRRSQGMTHNVSGLPSRPSRTADRHHEAQDNRIASWMQLCRRAGWDGAPRARSRQPFFWVTLLPSGHADPFLHCRRERG